MEEIHCLCVKVQAGLSLEEPVLSQDHVKVLHIYDHDFQSFMISIQTNVRNTTCAGLLRAAVEGSHNSAGSLSGVQCPQFHTMDGDA